LKTKRWQPTGAVALIAGVGTIVVFIAAKFRSDTVAVVALKASRRTVRIRLLGRRYAGPLIRDVNCHAMRTAAVPLQKPISQPNDETEV